MFEVETGTIIDSLYETQVAVAPVSEGSRTLVEYPFRRFRSSASFE